MHTVGSTLSSKNPPSLDASPPRASRLASLAPLPFGPGVTEIDGWNRPLA